jgi:hypothetical protein
LADGLGSELVDEEVFLREEKDITPWIKYSLLLASTSTCRMAWPTLTDQRKSVSTKPSIIQLIWIPSSWSSFPTSTSSLVRLFTNRRRFSPPVRPLPRELPLLLLPVAGGAGAVRRRAVKNRLTPSARVGDVSGGRSRSRLGTNFM